MAVTIKIGERKKRQCGLCGDGQGSLRRVKGRVHS